MGNNSNVILDNVYPKPLPVYPPISDIAASEFILNAEVSVQIWPSHISGELIPAPGSTWNSN